MEKITVKKFKWFWADQDTEQEHWLRAMARQGLHLHRVNAFCIWTFVQGEPADIAFQIDYSNKPEDSACHVLFKDTGWEHAAAAAGWQYWRKRVLAGAAPEILTDPQSRIDKYQRVLAMLVAAFMPMLVMLIITDKDLVLAQLSPPFLFVVVGLVAVLIPLYLYAGVRLFLRIRSVRSAGA